MTSLMRQTYDAYGHAAFDENGGGGGFGGQGFGGQGPFGPFQSQQVGLGCGSEWSSWGLGLDPFLLTLTLLTYKPPRSGRPPR